MSGLLLAALQAFVCSVLYPVLSRLQQLLTYLPHMNEWNSILDNLRRAGIPARVSIEAATRQSLLRVLVSDTAFQCY